MKRARVNNALADPGQIDVHSSPSLLWPGVTEGDPLPTATAIPDTMHPRNSNTP